MNHDQIYVKMALIEDKVKLKKQIMGNRRALSSTQETDLSL